MEYGRTEPCTSTEVDSDQKEAQLKRAFLLLLLTTATAGGVSLYLHRSAFCSSEFRFLSEQELIDAAIRDEIGPRAVVSNMVRGISRRGTPIKIDSPEAFREMHPECCTIASGTDEQGAMEVYGFLARLLGYHAVSVLINYNFRYIDDAGAERERFVETIVPLSSCGQVLLEPLRGGED